MEGSEGRIPSDRPLTPELWAGPQGQVGGRVWAGVLKRALGREVELLQVQGSGDWVESQWGGEEVWALLEVEKGQGVEEEAKGRELL